MLRILICRPDHIGDVLLTLPAALLLRRALPAARISFLVPPGSAEVPRHCPTIDETLPAPFPRLDDRDALEDWSQLVAWEAQTLRDRFDMALLPRPDDPWCGLLVAAAEIPMRVGYAAPRTAPYLTVRLPLPAVEPVTETAKAVALGALDAYGISVDDSASTSLPPVFVPSPAEEAESELVLRSLRLPSDALPLVLHPGSGWPLKNWPVKRWAELARRLAWEYRSTPLITGSAGEQPMIAEIVAASQGSAVSLASRLSLGALSALFARARAVIATDSGPLHLAALSGAPVVGLYGPADPALFAPPAPAERSRIVRVDLPCSPCGTLIDPPCGATVEPNCITGIAVEAVTAAVREMAGLRSSLTIHPVQTSEPDAEVLGC